ncbi:MAG: hypothetical protein IPM79_19850 [Polyangiaceae bacterium]|jgi:type VI protein secretion system component VasK|nr:hypothetical protein [Polyangiaceae bacterium]MBK8939808.1 hypothetical protein [Polyangiaceae bacterium]
MNRVFAAEFQQVLGRVRAQGGVYAVPWYLVVGEPSVGKSTVIRAMNLTWNDPPSVDGQFCQYWVSKEAVIIEAREPIIGPNKQASLLRELCEELRRIRSREPLDGIVLVMSATDVADRQDESLETHSQHLRTYLIEACRALEADVPVYVIINRFDTLWGYAEVFSWNADRAKEDAWGFLIPPDVATQNTWPKTEEGLVGLSARIEATCLSKLSSDEGIEQRIRAFQHLVESRVFLNRLRDVLKAISFSSAYERAPWMRAVIIGAAVPGVGDRIRAGLDKFQTMGIMQNPYDAHRSPRPGGLPLHTFFRSIILPEKELVPLKTKWRHDPVFVLGMILAFLFLSAGLILKYAVQG